MVARLDVLLLDWVPTLLDEPLVPEPTVDPLF